MEMTEAALGRETMRGKLFLLTVAVALALLCAAIAHAASTSLEEAGLTPYGKAYEIHRGPGEVLYLSDYDANEIWHIDASGAYTLYQVYETALDAQPDGAGNLWFTDGADIFGRLALSTGALTTWQAPELHNLWGLALDADGRVWMTEFIGANLYRFDPAATELCTYTLPAQSRSYYILHDAGRLWLRNWDEYRIYRVDLGSSQATWWQWALGPSSAEPAGLELDGGGSLWWADAGMGALARLDPDLDQMTTYTLPAGTTPRMLEVGPDGVWYSESDLGTVGLLDPASATGSTTAMATGSGSVTSECSPWEPGVGSSASMSSGTLSWTPGSVSTLVDGGGWKVYQLATGASPYGLADVGGSLWAADQGRQKLVRLSASLPAVDLEKHTNGQDADSPPGPAVTVGEQVNWTYRVENSGNVPLTEVTVVDDNGTPANPADDYECVIGSLAVGAVDDTTCAQSGAAVAGQYANTGTVTANAGAIPVSDTDPSHYLGGEGAVYVYLPLVLRSVIP
jgi:streptogramin lyase